MIELVIAIDPGPEESAYVMWDGCRVKMHANVGNSMLLSHLEKRRHDEDYRNVACAIEQVRGFGILASDGLFDTCQWTGRFLQAFGDDRTALIPRKMVSKHVCGTSGISHDKFIREALIKRLGPPGTKKAPGMLYGIAGHLWAALAVAVTYWDTLRPEARSLEDVVEALEGK